MRLEMNNLLLTDTMRDLEALINKSKEILEDSELYISKSIIENLAEDIKALKDRLLVEQDEIISKQNIDYNLIMLSKEQIVQEIEDISFTLKEIEDMIFLRPLERLSITDMEDLQEVIQDSDLIKNNNKTVILVPYDVDIMKIKALIKNPN